MTNLNEFLTPREAAVELRLSEMTLWRMRRDGSGPPWYRVGRGKRIFYRRDDLRDYLARARAR